MVEGLLSQQLLGIHHVRPGDAELAWDLGYLAMGAVLIVVGRLLARRLTPTPSR